MAQILPAKTVTLAELHHWFGLQQTEAEQLFPEWQLDLPELTLAETTPLDRVKSNFVNLLAYPPLLENTVKMVCCLCCWISPTWINPPFTLNPNPPFKL